MKSVRIMAKSKADLIPRVLAAAKDWDWSRTMLVTIGSADQKSKRQRGYQFGWVYPAIVEHLNLSGLDIEYGDGSREPWNVDLLHEFLKRVVLAPLMLELGERPWIVVDGKEIPTEALTTEGSMERFAAYITRVKAYAWARWECSIPEPLDDYYSAIERELQNAGRLKRAA